MAQIAWTRRAMRNLRRQRLSRKGNQTRGAVNGSTKRLARSPKIGGGGPEFDVDHVPQLVSVRPYRIIYVLREDTCHIVAVVHSSRNLQQLFTLADLEEI